VLDGRIEVEVAGGICNDIETVGVKVMDAILERDMLSYTVAIAFARDEVR